ncbi:MAG: hypothetical protein L6461_17300 [Anaerolineae bacterium]|nr:hypothetical protein [Anaerolineae bacterium]
MNKEQLFFQITFCVALTLLLFGCAINDPVTSLPATIPPEHGTETSTSLPSPHPSLTNTPTQAVTPSPEPKPFPTQGELSDKDFVLHLLQTNGGCELPCWWGIVPGETRWEDAELFLSRFTLRIEDDWEETKKGADGQSHQIKNFVVYMDIDQPDPGLFGIRIKDEFVTGIYVSRPLTKPHFSLRKLLNNQGVPSKIFIFTHSNVMEPPTPFDLILYYQEQRLLIIYTTLVYKENEQITACLDDVGPTIAVVSDEEALTDQQVQEFFIGPDPRGILSIEDALGITTDVFYETYRDSETICLTTPANIWP